MWLLRQSASVCSTCCKSGLRSGTSASRRGGSGFPVRELRDRDRRDHRLQRCGCCGNRLRSVLPAANLGSDRGHPRAGVAAAVFLYASSVIGIDGTIAYNDVAVAAIGFGLFYLLQIWDQDRCAKLLV